MPTKNLMPCLAKQMFAMHSACACINTCERAAQKFRRKICWPRAAECKNILALYKQDEGRQKASALRNFLDCTFNAQKEDPDTWLQRTHSKKMLCRQGKEEHKTLQKQAIEEDASESICAHWV
jgi:hypothetical protein